MNSGERIRLHAIERDDIPTFVRWFNQPEVRWYLLTYEPLSRAKEEHRFDAQLEACDDCLFGITPPARRCYEKAAFRLEGTRRQALYREECFHDGHVMAVLSTEFRTGEEGDA